MLSRMGKSCSRPGAVALILGEPLARFTSLLGEVSLLFSSPDFSTRYRAHRRSERKDSVCQRLRQ